MSFRPKPIPKTGNPTYLKDVPHLAEWWCDLLKYVKVGQYIENSWQWDELVADVRKVYCKEGSAVQCYWARTHSRGGTTYLTIYSELKDIDYGPWENLRDAL